MDEFGDIEMATRVSIIGVTGYTGLELLRLLNVHPQVVFAHVTSRQHDGVAIGDIYPHLAHIDLVVANPSLEDIARDSDVVFLCLPHRTAQDTVAALYGKVKIIDLSADFRLDNVQTYEKYYDCAHNYPDLLEKAVYGLPEIVGADAIAAADLIANPGCFALLGQMLGYPFQGQIETLDYIGITGSSGAGKSPTDGTHHPVRNHNVKSYNINKHRHIPEVCRSAGIDAERLNFVPTSGPFTRGIFGQAFITLADGVDIDKAVAGALSIYRNKPFMRYQKQVAVADVVGSNFVDVSFETGANGHIVAQGALDNLVKGAAGCAVQNMNLMCGYDETLCLSSLSPLYP